MPITLNQLVHYFVIERAEFRDQNFSCVLYLQFDPPHLNLQSRSKSKWKTNSPARPSFTSGRNSSWATSWTWTAALAWRRIMVQFRDSERSEFRSMAKLVS